VKNGKELGRIQNDDCGIGNGNGIGSERWI